MDIRVVEDTITFKELQKVAEEFYRSMVKGAIDIKREIVAFGGEYHIDAANKLAEIGSKTGGTWGFNIRLDKPPHSFIPYSHIIYI